MNNRIMSIKKFGLFLVTVLLGVSFSNAFGHGLGIDTIQPININGKEISISVELPMYADQIEKQLTITAKEIKSKENVQNIALQLSVIHNGTTILTDSFFSHNGIIRIAINSSEDTIQVSGEKTPFNTWYVTDTKPAEITGSIFDSGGLYTFEITILSIDEIGNTIENSSTYYADLTLIEPVSYIQKDSENNNTTFRMKSYFDKISNFTYDPISKQVTFEMPFDWRESRMSHVPVVHEEVHFPKDFAELLAPSYTGTANGIELFKSSISVDDYTEENERIVHFVLLQDHLRFLKNQQTKFGNELPQNIVFTLTPSDTFEFPISAITKNEELQIDLSWEPRDILPNSPTKFVFTIRDGSTGEPMRNSVYEFVIIHNGEEIHRTSGNVQVGGGFEEYTFSDDQTGPIIIRFENLRNSDLETEFSVVVAPEFGVLYFVIFGISVGFVLFFSKLKIIKY